MIKQEIEEARALLGKKYDFIPDKSMELMINCFNLLAKLLMENARKESE